jgi:hypothetical protein
MIPVSSLNGMEAFSCFVATADRQQTCSSIAVCFCMIFILFLENTCNRAI